MSTGTFLTPEERSVWLRGSRTGVDGLLELGRRHHAHLELRLDPHVHAPDRLEICYLHKGRKSFRVGHRWFTLKGGDVLMILPGDVHSGSGPMEERGLLYWVALRIPRSDRAFLGLAAARARPLKRLLLRPKRRHFPGSAGLHDCLEGMIGAASQLGADPLAAAQVHSRLILFLVEVIACAGRTRRRPPGWTDRIFRHIEQHLSEPIRVSALATMTGLSVSRFERRFKQETGSSPADYILRRKIDLAKERLRRKDASVTPLAFDLGFSSSQYFATVFKRYTGRTPTQYRRGGRGRDDAGDRARRK